jgi:hypothetical protein
MALVKFRMRQAGFGELNRRLRVLLLRILTDYSRVRILPVSPNVCNFWRLGYLMI